MEASREECVNYWNYCEESYTIQPFKGFNSFWVNPFFLWSLIFLIIKTTIHSPKKTGKNRFRSKAILVIIILLNNVVSSKLICIWFIFASSESFFNWFEGNKNRYLNQNFDEILFQSWKLLNYLTHVTLENNLLISLL